MDLQQSDVRQCPDSEFTKKGKSQKSKLSVSEDRVRVYLSRVVIWASLVGIFLRHLSMSANDPTETSVGDPVRMAPLSVEADLARAERFQSRLCESASC